MEEKIYHKLEYDKIIDLLVKACASQMGKEIAAGLRPSLSLPEVSHILAETTQGKEVLRLHPNFSLGGIRDVRSPLHKAEMGGIIEPQEFLALDDTIGASRRIKGFFGGDGEKYELLADYARSLGVFPELEHRIKRVVTADGDVSDNASAELARIRKQLRSLQGKAREKLESIIRSPELQKYLQDPLITIRNERYVIPVKQEYRNQIPGLVHDQSGSGATLFIEPIASVELTNEVKRYEAMERAEVSRILRELTGAVRQKMEDLRHTLEALAQLDFIIAKAKLSMEMDGGAPLMNDQGHINIIQGRHPLIRGRVVPITISLGRDFDTLVITGPNTGGKTVTLKTVGLFILMAQSGLHVPAQDGTDLAVFCRVYADIGDEQSIEQSLSTFSSHMTNIIKILEDVNEQTLVLLDELGAGTDPTEGAALAMSILEHLIRVGAKTIATTHYSELKSFAYSQERVENASVEFDAETLRPTYRLLIGVPGRSNAFEISLRLGLMPHLVERARSFLSQEELKMADLIADLETNQILSERERKEAEKLKKLAQTKLRQLEKRELEHREKTGTIIRKAQEEALEIVSRARRESETLLKEAREALKKAPRETQEELLAMRNSLREKEAVLQDEIYQDTGDESPIPRNLEPGDMVLIKRLNQKAQVLEKPKNDEEVLVRAGVMKLSVKLKDLRKLEEENYSKQAERTGVGQIVAGKAREIRSELDLRGLTVDEALAEVDKYLDDAYLAGLSQASIIHGKGTGALRSAITELVIKHRFVESHRFGGYYEGGHGVTVVQLKK